jgi:hypothetical protein
MDMSYYYGTSMPEYCMYHCMERCEATVVDVPSLARVSSCTQYLSLLAHHRLIIILSPNCLPGT